MRVGISPKNRDMNWPSSSATGPNTRATASVASTIIIAMFAVLLPEWLLVFAFARILLFIRSTNICVSSVFFRDIRTTFFIKKSRKGSTVPASCEASSPGVRQGFGFPDCLRCMRIHREWPFVCRWAIRSAAGKTRSSISRVHITGTKIGVIRALIGCGCTSAGRSEVGRAGS